MITINNLEEMKKYYVEEINTYVFNDNVEFNFDVMVNSDINARDITAYDIKALNIKAWDINAKDINAKDINAWDINAYDIKALNIKANDIGALDINAWDIEADNISYYAICFAYKNIKCKSISGRRKNHKHFVLDGKLEVEYE